MSEVSYQDAVKAKEWLASHDYLIMSSIPNRWYLVRISGEDHFTNEQLIAFAKSKGWDGQ